MTLPEGSRIRRPWRVSVHGVGDEHVHSAHQVDQAPCLVEANVDDTVQRGAEQVLDFPLQGHGVGMAIQGIDAFDAVDGRDDASEIRRHVEDRALAGVRIIEENLEEKRLLTVWRR